MNILLTTKLVPLKPSQSSQKLITGKDHQDDHLIIPLDHFLRQSYNVDPFMTMIWQFSPCEFTFQENIV